MVVRDVFFSTIAAYDSPMHFIRCMQSSYFVIYSIFVLQAFRYSFAVIVRCKAKREMSAGVPCILHMQYACVWEH